MDCEKVRDRFSAFLENELLPPEEEAVRTHLASCEECRKDLRGFEKTMAWLHAAREVDVPEGFLSETFEKLEARKSVRKLPERTAWKNLFLIPRMRLPVQAAAMVGVIFLVLYITRMEPPHVTSRKAEDSPRIAMQKEKAPPREETLSGEPRGESLEPSRKPEVLSSGEKPEAKERQTPEPAAPALVKKESRPGRKEPAGEERPPPPVVEGERRIGALKPEREEALPAAPPSSPALKEIDIRVSDREQFLLRLAERLREFGGSLVSREESLIVVSLPSRSVEEFERELKGGSAGKEPSLAAEKAAGTIRLKEAPPVKDALEKATEAAPSPPVRKEFVSIRIHLLPP